jgi:hypothetical protein
MAQKRAYAIADNKIAEQAGWDRELLAVELGELVDLLPAEGMDVSLTGLRRPKSTCSSPICPPVMNRKMSCRLCRKKPLPAQGTCGCLQSTGCFVAMLEKPRILVT